mmetsp:Transcript_1688/g.2300  ORF Transcript_1688/g.2300 Transcript_1688/m.2300 type:complete len:153 (+) Transcript_1688:108-566(+)
MEPPIMDSESGNSNAIVCCCSWKSLLNMLPFPSTNNSRIKGANPIPPERSMKEQNEISNNFRLLEFLIFTATDAILEFITNLLFHYVMTVQYLFGFNLLGATARDQSKSSNKNSSLKEPIPIGNPMIQVPHEPIESEEFSDYGFFVDVSAST